jgi:hypothetical protein
VAQFPLFKGFRYFALANPLVTTDFDFDSAIFMNVIVGLVIGRAPSHWFLGGGTLLTGLGNVLYAARKEDATYWGYEFCAQILSYGGPGLGKRPLFYHHPGVAHA